MGVYLYNPCLPNLRTTGIPYARCGAPMGLKFTEEEFQEVLPSLMAFRDSSTLEVDYVFSQTADGPHPGFGANPVPSRYTVNSDFSGTASRDDSNPIIYSVLQENGTYKDFRHSPGTNPLTTNFCDSFPPLTWTAGGVTRTDCTESGVEECSGYYDWSCVGYDFGGMCWHPTIHQSVVIPTRYAIPCSPSWAMGPNEIRIGYSCYVIIPSNKKVNQSCCYTHIGGKAIPNSNSAVSQIEIDWGGVSKTPEGDYVVFTPTVKTSYNVRLGRWGGWWGPGSYTEEWGTGCLCTPLEFVHLLGRFIPANSWYRNASICAKDYDYDSYSGCGGRNYMQGGPGYFPIGPVESTTGYVYRGDGRFTPGQINYNNPTPNGPYYEVIPNSNATWRFSGGCWVFGTSNYESESCGEQSFSVFIRLCPGDVVDYESEGGCRNF